VAAVGLKPARTLRSRVRIPVEARIYVRVFLCCDALCKQETYDGPILRSRSPHKMSKWIRNFRVSSEFEQARGRASTRNVQQHTGNTFIYSILKDQRHSSRAFPQIKALLPNIWSVSAVNNRKTFT
jgi:hypothetical protein